MILTKAYSVHRPASSRESVFMHTHTTLPSIPSSVTSMCLQGKEFRQGERGLEKKRGNRLRGTEREIAGGRQRKTDRDRARQTERPMVSERDRDKERQRDSGKDTQRERDREKKRERERKRFCTQPCPK